MRTCSRRLASAVSLSALVLGVSACSGGDEDGAAEGTSRSASSSTTTPSETADATEDLEPTEGTEAEENEVPDAAEGGETDPAAFVDRLESGMGEEGSAHVALAVKAPSARLDAEGDTTYGPDGSEMRLTMQLPQAGGRKITVLIDDGTAYMSLGGVTPPGKFFKVPANSPALASLNSGSLSPAESIKGFEAGLERVEHLGPDQIRGEDVEHYELTLDAVKTLEAMGNKQVPGMPPRLVYDLWLDDQDRMRRATYELSGVQVVMDITDWGKPVDIQPPAKADLVKAPPGI